MNENFSNDQKVNMSIEGVGSISSGSYGKVSVEGVGKINGDISFEKMNIEGTCTAKANLSGNVMDVQGVLTAKGDVKVRRLDVEGVMKSDKKIYADDIVVSGVLKNNDEVNADRVTIEGVINVKDLFGDEISMNYPSHMFHSFSFGLGKKIFTKMNTAHNIECSKLKACRITCHSICATEIYLSDHCIVDTITCNGTLHYDSTCEIKHIEGECTSIPD